MIQDWLIRNLQHANSHVEFDHNHSTETSRLNIYKYINIYINMITSVVCYYNMLACIQGSVLLPYSDAIISFVFY